MHITSLVVERHKITHYTLLIAYRYPAYTRGSGFLFNPLFKHKLFYGVVVDNLLCLCYYEDILSEMVDTVEKRIRGYTPAIIHQNTSPRP